MEQRAKCELIELRLLDGDHPVIEGHAAVFNQRSHDLGFREIILPGAFTDAIKTDDVKFLLNHQGLPLARTKSRTLRLEEDQRGLKFRAELDPSDPDAQRLIPKVRRGDLSDMSFGFEVRSREDELWDWDGQVRIRQLKKVSLFDISAVAHPAYPSTDLSLRSYFEARIAELKPLPDAQPPVDQKIVTEPGLKIISAEEFQARREARLALIQRLTLPPDKNSLPEFLKRCRI